MICLSHNEYSAHLSGENLVIASIYIYRKSVLQKFGVRYTATAQCASILSTLHCVKRLSVSLLSCLGTDSAVTGRCWMALVGSCHWSFPWPVSETHLHFTWIKDPMAAQIVPFYPSPSSPTLTHISFSLFLPMKFSPRLHKWRLWFNPARGQSILHRKGKLTRSAHSSLLLILANSLLFWGLFLY